MCVVMMGMMRVFWNKFQSLFTRLILSMYYAKCKCGGFNIRMQTLRYQHAVKSGELLGFRLEVGSVCPGTISIK